MCVTVVPKLKLETMRLMYKEWICPEKIPMMFFLKEEIYKTVWMIKNLRSIGGSFIWANVVHILMQDDEIYFENHHLREFRGAFQQNCVCIM